MFSVICVSLFECYVLSLEEKMFATTVAGTSVIKSFWYDDARGEFALDFTINVEFSNFFLFWREGG